MRVLKLAESKEWGRFITADTPPFPFFFCAFIMTLLSRLRDYRQMRSTLDCVPIYCVFGDTVMGGIAMARPQTMQALLAVRGFTPEKYGQYGHDILKLVRGTPPDPPDPGHGSRIVMRHSGGGGGKHGKWTFPTTSSGKRQMMARLLSRLWTPLMCSELTHGVAGALCNRPYSMSCRNKDRDDVVYILELAKGRVYVGRTADQRRRLSQHMAGRGSAFTQAFPPTGVLLPRLGRVSGSAEAAERDETLRYMHLRGIDFVRGWKYTRVVMSEDEQQEAEENIRELFDLCRRCGCPGHFVSQCKATKDRLGRPLGAG